MWARIAGGLYVREIRSRVGSRFEQTHTPPGIQTGPTGAGDDLNGQKTHPASCISEGFFPNTPLGSEAD